MTLISEHDRGYWLRQYVEPIIDRQMTRDELADHSDAFAERVIKEVPLRSQRWVLGQIEFVARELADETRRSMLLGVVPKLPTELEGE